MAYEIEFSKRSVSELKLTIEYLLDNWPVKAAGDFIEKFYSKINNISRHPFSYSKSVY